MLKSVFISLFLFLCNSLYAIPTRRLVVLSQKDGTTINAYLVGDEYFHYHMTEDAIPILQSNDGGWYYANINNNEFFPSEMMAHNECQRSGIETQFLKDNYTETNFYLDVSDTDHYICKDCFENDKDKFLKYNKEVQELVDNFQTQLNNLQKDIIKK